MITTGIDKQRTSGTRAGGRIALCAGAVLLTVAASSCGGTEGGTDANASYDARPGFVQDPMVVPPVTPNGAIYVRLANMIVAGPNLTICISTIPGTGVPETPGHMIGTVNEAAGLDGTLPYPGISPYIPFPTYPTEGFAYVIRLYDRADLPFAALGATCPTVGAIEPVVTGTVVTAEASPRQTMVAMGVPEGAPVTCARGCPAPSTVFFTDDLTPTEGMARVRIVQTVPNLIAPLHICFDPDFVDAANPGDLPSTRVLPERSDINGISYAEATPYIDVPPLSGTPGAFFVHLTVPGPPDCAAATLALGPITLPFPVPATAPDDVARTIDAGDVLSLFAFGRLGATCGDDTVCAPTGGTCNTARRICEDVLSPSVLPWQDVMGM